MRTVPMIYILPNTDYTLCRFCSNLLEYCGCEVSEVHPVIREANGIFTKWAFVIKIHWGKR